MALPEPASFGPRRKRKAAAALLYLSILAFCLAGGLIAGPTLRAVYADLFPEPAYTRGDFGLLYRDAGKSIVMFSTSTCPFCKRTRELLAREHVDYRDYVVDQLAESEQRFDALGGRGVPLLFIGDRRIEGFREDVIRESLVLSHARRSTDAVLTTSPPGASAMSPAPPSAIH